MGAPGCTGELRRLLVVRLWAIDQKNTSIALIDDTAGAGFSMGSLRFLLALAVAGRHAAGFFGLAATWIFPGAYAVQRFYIVSGFLMAMILNGKYADTPRGNWIFYTNRIVKIFVPYLAVLAVTVAVCLLSKAATGNALLLENWFTQAGVMTFATWAFAALTNIFIVGQEWGFLLNYRAGSLFYSLQAFSEPPIGSQFTVIAPAWTISIELLFYIVAPFVVRCNILLIAALAYASYYCRFEAYHHGYYSEATNYRFFPFELSLFLYGSLCYRVGQLLPRVNTKWSNWITAAVALAVIATPEYFTKHPYQMYFVVGLLLPNLFDFSRRTGWDRSLGELSYPLYLCHWPILVFAATLLPSASELWAALAVAFSVATATIINRFVVKPIDGWRQSRAVSAIIQSPVSGKSAMATLSPR
jgi:peptidoglycan/LPS O-acetylase OafA/YrhL